MNGYCWNSNGDTGLSDYCTTATSSSGAGGWYSYTSGSTHYCCTANKTNGSTGSAKNNGTNYTITYKGHANGVETTKECCVNAASAPKTYANSRCWNSLSTYCTTATGNSGKGGYYKYTTSDEDSQEICCKLDGTAGSESTYVGSTTATTLYLKNQHYSKTCCHKLNGTKYWYNTSNEYSGSCCSDESNKACCESSQNSHNRGWYRSNTCCHDSLISDNCCKAINGENYWLSSDGTTCCSSEDQSAACCVSSYNPNGKGKTYANGKCWSGTTPDEGMAAYCTASTGNSGQGGYYEYASGSTHLCCKQNASDSSITTYSGSNSYTLYIRNQNYSKTCCHKLNGTKYWYNTSNEYSGSCCSSENTSACCTSSQNSHSAGKWSVQLSGCCHNDATFSNVCCKANNNDNYWLSTNTSGTKTCCSSENSSDCCTSTNTSNNNTHKSAGKWSAQLAACCHGNATDSNACCKANNNDNYWLSTNTSGTKTCCSSENSSDCCTSTNTSNNNTHKSAGKWVTKGTYGASTDTCCKSETTSDVCCKAKKNNNNAYLVGSTCCNSENDSSTCCTASNNPNGVGTWTGTSCSHCSGWYDASGNCCTVNTQSDACCKASRGNTCSLTNGTCTCPSDCSGWLAGSTCCTDQNTSTCCTASNNPNGQGKWRNSTCCHSSTSSDNCCKAYNGESYWLSSNSTCDCTDENTTACCQSDNNPSGKGTWISATSTCSHTSCSGWLDSSGNCCTSENTSACCTTTNTGTGHSSAGKWTSQLATCCHGNATSSNACCKANNNDNYWLGGSTCCSSEDSSDCCTSTNTGGTHTSAGTWASSSNTCCHDANSSATCCTAINGNNYEYTNGSCVSKDPNACSSGQWKATDDTTCCSDNNSEKCCESSKDGHTAGMWGNGSRHKDDSRCCLSDTESQICCEIWHETEDVIDSFDSYDTHNYGSMHSLIDGSCKAVDATDLEGCGLRRVNDDPTGHDSLVSLFLNMDSVKECSSGGYTCWDDADAAICVVNAIWHGYRSYDNEDSWTDIYYPYFGVTDYEYRNLMAQILTDAVGGEYSGYYSSCSREGTKVGDQCSNAVTFWPAGDYCNGGCKFDVCNSGAHDIKTSTVDAYIANGYCEWVSNRCSWSGMSAYCCEQVYGGIWQGRDKGNDKCTVYSRCSRDANHNNQCWGAGCNQC